ncbi:katanin p80 WD40 repeat-containing subunit B1-like [Sinocyclocheilus anshuiensis]|uniref:Katanin p80 WD40 repeat-containing subunit B1 n=1 Tax=Sinocyclocheilus anshuiensis TaxID=1608454 RepID=A0A671M9X1_9TELE|nr:PREDICTED: katanin p80 WD40 repeat-containing subunit B1-like [Sinocyclocheilus anshuiensis]
MALTSTTITSWKLQEIVAHSSNVSSLVLGKSSGRLLATGGEDCRVNIWAVSKPNCIMSLTGHTSPVECIQFNSSEERVVAGSQSGSLRLWDLEAAKSKWFVLQICTLVNIKSTIRNKVILLKPGHTQAVRCLAFSPDGKWLASASDDSTVKLWDLIAGKMITEFTSHTSAVNAVQFHPNEYLLATGSADRTVKLWDLEKFNMIGSSEGETGVVRSILFNPDGSCLYSGSENTLRVYGWEPDRCFDVVHVGWGKVSDLAISNNQMIAVSYSQNNVNWYIVDLNRVKKSGSVIQGLIEDKPIPAPTSAMGTTLRRNYERPTTSCTGQEMKQSSEADRRSPEGERRSPSSEDEKEDKESSAEITNPEDYKEIFQPHSVISRTPPKGTEPFPAPLDHSFSESVLEKPGPAVKIATPVIDRAGQLKGPITFSTPVQRVEPTVIAAFPRPVAVVTTSVTSPSRPVVTATKPKPSTGIILSTRNEPVGLTAGDFLSHARNAKAGVMGDDEALAQIRKGHDTMCVMLTSRYKNLDTVRSVWASGDVKTSLDSAVSMNDLSIVVDILNIINLKPSLWKLDLCTSILPQIEELLQSKYESYVQTGCMALKLILKRFWPLISDTLTAPPSVGVDITREERHQKCKACYKQLKNLSNVVKNRAEQVGRHGSTFKELQLLMAPLDY